MGVKRNSNAITFIRIRSGLMPIQVPSPTKISVEYEIQKGPNAGKKVQEELYDELEGKILDIFPRDHNEYGRSWCILVQDDEEEMFQLEFPNASRYMTGFFTRLENCDLGKPVSFRTWSIMQDNGKYKFYGTIQQDGQKISQKYTKDNPNGMPDLAKVVFQGKEQWDSFARDQFLAKLVENLRPLFKQNIGRAAEHKPETPPSGQPNYNPAHDQGQVHGYNPSGAPSTTDNEPEWTPGSPTSEDEDLPF